MTLEDGENFMNFLNTHEKVKTPLENLYSTVNNVHSHLITGPDRASFDRLLKDLEKNEEILGINLTDKQIAEITRNDMNRFI